MKHRAQGRGFARPTPTQLSLERNLGLAAPRRSDLLGAWPTTVSRTRRRASRLGRGHGRAPAPTRTSRGLASSVSTGSATEGVARSPRSASPASPGGAAAVPVSALGDDAFRVWVSPETQHLLNLESPLDALTLFADFDIVEATTSRHNHDNLIKICMFFADQSHVDRVVEWVVAHRGAEHQRHIAAGCEHAVCIPKPAPATTAPSSSAASATAATATAAARKNPLHRRRGTAPTNATRGTSAPWSAPSLFRGTAGAAAPRSSQPRVPSRPGGKRRQRARPHTSSSPFSASAAGAARRIRDPKNPYTAQSSRQWAARHHRDEVATCSDRHRGLGCTTGHCCFVGKPGPKITIPAVEAAQLKGQRLQPTFAMSTEASIHARDVATVVRVARSSWEARVERQCPHPTDWGSPRVWRGGTQEYVEEEEGCEGGVGR